MLLSWTFKKSSQTHDKFSDRKKEMRKIHTYANFTFIAASTKRNHKNMRIVIYPSLSNSCKYWILPCCMLFTKVYKKATKIPMPSSKKLWRILKQHLIFQLSGKRRISMESQQIFQSEELEAMPFRYRRSDTLIQQEHNLFSHFPYLSWETQVSIT